MYVYKIEESFIENNLISWNFAINLSLFICENIFLMLTQLEYCKKETRCHLEISVKSCGKWYLYYILYVNVLFTAVFLFKHHIQAWHLPNIL